jgi:two-component system, LytTR family, response regulator
MILRTLLIDDEAPARRRLSRLLQHHAHRVQLVGEASNGEEGLLAVERLQPDLLFLDIQMPGLTGFEMLEKLDVPSPRVIFTTAYDAYALKAFEQNTVDYLLKPIDELRLTQALEKLQALAPIPTHWQEMLQQLVRKDSPPRMHSLSVKMGDRVIFIPIDEISFLEATEKYVDVHTVQGKKYLVDKSLTTLEGRLPHGFVRIQRSYIIQLAHVVEAHRHFNSRYIFQMKGGQRIVSGKSYYPVIQQIIS